MLARDHRDLARHRASGIVHGQRCAAEERGNCALPIERDVDAEVEREQRAVVSDARLRRITVEDAPRAAWIADHPRIVIPHDRIDVRQCRKDPLVAAGESRHEVRFDEAEHDAPIGLDVAAAERDR